jgi:hypothetical protein
LERFQLKFDGGLEQIRPERLELVVCNVKLHEFEDLEAHADGTDTTAWASSDADHHLDRAVAHRGAMLLEDSAERPKHAARVEHTMPEFLRNEGCIRGRRVDDRV